MCEKFGLGTRLDSCVLSPRFLSINTIEINFKYNGNLNIVFHKGFLPNSCMNSLKMFLIDSFKIMQLILQLFMYV